MFLLSLGLHVVDVCCADGGGGGGGIPCASGAGRGGGGSGSARVEEVFKAGQTCAEASMLTGLGEGEDRPHSRWRIRDGNQRR